jgi:hypothetical protein
MLVDPWLTMLPVPVPEPEPNQVGRGAIEGDAVLIKARKTDRQTEV